MLVSLRVHLLHHHESQASDLALKEIERYLMALGISLVRCGLPQPTEQRRDTELDIELNYFHRHLTRLRRRADNAVAIMNTDQRYIFDHIMEKIRLAEDSCFSVDGRAGRGKTFLMTSICDCVRSTGGIICIVGTS